MSQTELSAPACPLCHHLDQVQKVRAINSGGAEGLRVRLAKPAFPALPEYRPAVRLPPAPTPPTSPRRTITGLLFGRRGARNGVLSFLFQMAFACLLSAPAILLSLWVGGLHDPLRMGLSDTTTIAVATALAVIGAISGLTLIWSLRTVIRSQQRQFAADLKTYEMKKHAADEANEPRRRAHDAALREWVYQVNLTYLAQQTWATKLYYCHRDDVVFLQDEQGAVPPEQMNDLLTDYAARTHTLAEVLALDLPSDVMVHVPDLVVSSNPAFGSLYQVVLRNARDATTS